MLASSTTLAPFTSAARTATATSAVSELVGATMLAVAVDVTAQSGTTPTLDVTVEGSATGTGGWSTLATVSQYSAATGSKRVSIGPQALPRFIRTVATIGGSSPSFTFAVTLSLDGSGGSALDTAGTTALINTALNPVKSADASVRVTKSDANLSVGIVANTWHDLDPNGSSSARPLDIVIPNATVGQWVEVKTNLYALSTATAVYLDIFTVVGGAPIHQFGQAATGTVGWLLPASLAYPLSATARYQIQTGDIENGAVRLRLRDRNTTTTARQIGSSGGIEFELAGSGPFG